MAKDILIAYFSHSANTHRVAAMIGEKTGGVLFEIQPEIPYPSSYNAVLEQAKKEIKAGFQPSLKTKIMNIEAYEIVFVGSPNWCNTIAPPLKAFLSENNLSGKKIIPFCTHGGGGAGNSERDIRGLCPGAKMLPGLSIAGSGDGDAQVDRWLQRIEIDI